MFEKISELKNFGIFRDFSWDKHTPDLAKFNLIYGWNRSGKTTLSRVFAACEKRTTDFDGYPRDGEFEIKVKGGSPVVNHNNCQDTTHHVRVFNRDFVEENVFFDSKGSRTNPIVYVSKEDIESDRELKKLQNKESSLRNTYDEAEKVWNEKKNEEVKFRRRTARLIKDTVGIEVNDRYRNYDRSNLKDEIERTGIENFRKLSPEDYEKQIKLTRSERPKVLETLSEYSFDLQYEDRTLHGLSEISEKFSALLARSVVSETIERLKGDGEINKWAEDGFHLHKNKNEEGKCLFCQNELKPDFLESLSKHFSDDYGKLQRDIDSFIDGLSDLKKGKILKENQMLSSDLQDKYKGKAEAMNAILEEINGWIDKATENLKKKRGNPLLTVEPIECPKDFGRLCNEVIQDLNSVVKEHNRESRNHVQIIKEAKEILKDHIIASAIKEERYKEIKLSVDSWAEKKEKANEKLQDNREKISGLEQKISDIGGAVAEINRHLEDFFGREEIALELDSSKKGYMVKRNGGYALNLSEGEKNAIAFSYFIVKTREKGFNIKEGIIVIDDPVSSFDSNFTYHCFSLVKNSFKNAKQLILLTHNFEVFNLVKNHWFYRKNKKTENRNKKSEGQPRPHPCKFFMIRNEVRNEHRYALVAPLDKTLQKFNSEYHFLFSELKQFLKKPGNDYADFYRIGNVARRFLETYANLKIPTTDDLRNKLDQLCNGCIRNGTGAVNETEKDKLYRLINESSHVRDPAGAFEHKDRSEIENAIRILMKIVEGSDERHFKSLCKET